MPEKRYDLREIARAAISDIPPRQRAKLLTEMLVEIDGGDALQLLADARNIVTLRIKQLVDERYPSDPTEPCNIQSIHERFNAVACPGKQRERFGLFDLTGAKRSLVDRRIGHIEDIAQIANHVAKKKSSLRGCTFRSSSSFPIGVDEEVADVPATVITGADDV